MTAPAARWAELVDGGAVRLDGFHAVKHALRFGAAVELVLAADPPRALRLAQELAADVREPLRALAVEVDEGTLRSLAGPVAHHTGIVALATPRRWTLADVTATPAPVVLLDGPRDPGNYGAVVRVAAGLGAAGVVSTGTLDPWHPAVVRGAAGLQFAIPVCRLDDTKRLSDRPLFAFDAAGADARRAEIPDDAVLAFGSERSGLSSTIREQADALLALPMRDGVASYNLATAVAMVIYQWSLRRAAG
jgi:RNA methyltransferase, TrmH family